MSGVSLSMWGSIPEGSVLVMNRGEGNVLS